MEDFAQEYVSTSFVPIRFKHPDDIRKNTFRINQLVSLIKKLKLVSSASIQFLLSPSSSKTMSISCGTKYAVSMPNHFIVEPLDSIDAIRESDVTCLQSESMPTSYLPIRYSRRFVDVKEKSLFISSVLMSAKKGMTPQMAIYDTKNSTSTFFTSFNIQWTVQTAYLMTCPSQKVGSQRSVL